MTLEELELAIKSGEVSDASTVSAYGLLKIKDLI